MSAVHRPPARRKGVRRAVVLMPNGLTLFNLFCGVYAIVLGTRGKFDSAFGYIVLGGIADTLDGRVARATSTGSKFGEELDSLVDAISFGFAPALIVYLGLPTPGNWEWLLIFLFSACAVMRLARFNVEQAGRKKTHFHGLPSPAAGLTLASYYWFRETPLYNQAVILFTDSKTLSDLPWPTILPGLMAVLAALMISDVPYPSIPSVGFGNIRKIIGTVVVAGSVLLLAFRRKEFIFPALLAYVLVGAIKWVILGFVGRSTTPGEIFWDERAEREARKKRRRLFGRQAIVEMDEADVAELDVDDLDVDERSREERPRDERPREERPRVDRPRDERPRDERPRDERPRDERPRDERPRDERSRGERPAEDAAQVARRKRRRRGRGGGNRPPGGGSTPPGPPLPDSPSGPTE
jgi:CDP-diacylglycerol---serine O-phosphatidyltransferase